MKPKLTQTDLLKMLSYRRPAWSATERDFIASYLDSVPGMYKDGFGNRLLVHPNSKVLISCHTDTVHRVAGRQRVSVTGALAYLPKTSTSNCLGADDTAGVYAALRMIEAGVPVSYVFHRDEESGGRGSSWLASAYPTWLETFDVCLALDRRGTQDIITSQWSGESASEDFAYSLAEQLDLGHSPSENGIFTDSANYVDLIPECSNLSVGYRNEHFQDETLDLVYLEALIQRLCTVDWRALVIARDPALDFYEGYGLETSDGLETSEDWLRDWQESDWRSGSCGVSRKQKTKHLTFGS